MYYIYHIPGVKIGCTKNLKNRLSQQTKGDWELLEEHNDIHIASEREIELQKQYGYKVDTATYEKSVSGYSKEKIIKAGRASATKQWQENRNKELEKCSKGGKVNAKKYSKVTHQCDLDWNIIKTFSSSKEAAVAVNGHPSVIRMTILSKGTYRGFRWKYPTS
jgi:hypothetical protein